MFDTSKQILKFYEKEVALAGDERTAMRARRNTNRQRLKDGLTSDGKPKPYGMWSQGSYAMHTMIQDSANDYDIDDGAYFQKDNLVGPNGGEMTALAVRQMVSEALRDERFKKQPEPLKNCVRVYYNEGFHVDVPSYRRIVEVNHWTGKEVERFELASADWKTSDPREVTRWFKRQNKNLSTDFDETEGRYLRIVKLLKMFARSRPSWKGKIATGFMITKLVSDHFYQFSERDDFTLRQVMKSIVSRGQKDIAHPTLPGEIISDTDDPRLPFLQERLKENLAHLDVLDDPNCKHTDAMGAWDKVFNTTWFSDQPEPEGGERTFGTGSTPTAPVQKRGGGRYGSKVDP